MSELNNTVLAGVLILVLGQLLSRFVLDPLQEWSKLRGEIAHALHYYGNVHVTESLDSQGRGEEARLRLRDLAGQIWQRTSAIPSWLYFLLALLHLLPSWKDVQDASSGLTGLSNTMRSPETQTRPGHRQQVRKALRIKGDG